MVELKTKKTAASVSAFLNAIEDAQVRKDCKHLPTLTKLIQAAVKDVQTKATA
ncbi:MAG: hypothetical protein WC815_07215 [Vicinamibacterales bacterium]|jgi:hypothetical protein